MFDSGFCNGLSLAFRFIDCSTLTFHNVVMSTATNPPEELESFSLTPGGKPRKKALLAYERDGVVCLRRAFSQEWVSLGRRAVAAAIRCKTMADTLYSHTKRGDEGAFFFETFVWKRLPSFRRFTFESPAASLARDVMRSHSLLLYFDMAIVKEPGYHGTNPVALRRSLLAGLGHPGLQCLDGSGLRTTRGQSALRARLASIDGKLQRR